MTSSAVSKFVRIIDWIDQSKHRSEVFQDFCELSYCALAKNASPNPKQKDDLEAQYMAVVAKYRNKDDVCQMPKLLAIAVTELSGGGCDFLGAVAGELGVLDSKLGQFFTPYEVSRLMAEITMTEVSKTIAEKGFVTIDEPAAGAGGMLLAVADVIEGKGHRPETTIWVEATELSRPTFYMCYIQLAARGLSGIVFCGNSLSMEMFTKAFLPATSMFLNKHGDPFKKQREARQRELDCQEKTANEREQTKFEDISISTVATQLALFE